MKRRASLLAPLLYSLALHASWVGGFAAWHGLSRGSVTSPTRAVSEPIGVSVLGSKASARAEKTVTHSGAIATPATPGGATSSEARVDAIATVHAPTELTAYADLVRTRIGGSLSYPLAVRRRGIQGRVGLKLILSTDGKIQSRQIEEASGSPELDRLALEAVTAAEPYPQPPESLKKQGDLVLRLPIEFKLR